MRSWPSGTIGRHLRTRISVPPLAAANGGPWRTWLILGGRGAGKTRAGAEWVSGIALGDRSLMPQRRSAASR